VLQPRVLGRERHVVSLRLLLLAREMLPEERDAVRRVRAFERLLDAGGVVHVGGDHLRAGLRQRLGLVRVDVARERAHSESSLGIRENRMCQSAALGTGRAGDRNDLLFHRTPLFVWRWSP
jgi:hypothetical protein